VDRQQIKRLQRLIKETRRKRGATYHYDQPNLDAVERELSSAELAVFLQKFADLQCECGCGGMVKVVEETDTTALDSVGNWRIGNRFYGRPNRFIHGHSGSPGVRWPPGYKGGYKRKKGEPPSNKAPALAVGEGFHHLRVTGTAPSRNHRTYVQVECDCGNAFEAEQRKVETGVTQRCRVCVRRVRQRAGRGVGGWNRTSVCKVCGAPRDSPLAFCREHWLEYRKAKYRKRHKKIKRPSFTKSQVES
jgi:hypothetical protein